MKTINEIMEKINSLEEYKANLKIRFEKDEIDVKYYADMLIFISHNKNVLEWVLEESEA
jgi:hypothetical protein